MGRDGGPVGQAHPARAEQTIALGRGVEPMWSECDVPLNAWVIRCWHKTKKRTDPLGLVTPDRKVSAPWIVRHDEERPEIAQDYQQMKSSEPRTIHHEDDMKMEIHIETSAAALDK